MASFTLDFVPSVSASVAAGDTQLGLDYDGSLENDWTNTGTNARLVAVDGSVLSWNTIALGASSRKLNLSSFVNLPGGQTLANHASGWATVTAFSLLIDGTVAVSSLDLTACTIVGGLRQQPSGGIYTDGVSSGPQFSDGGALINNGGAGVGTYPASGEITTTDALGGLASANAVLMFRSAAFLASLLVGNDTSTVFTLNWDRIRLRISGTTGSIPVSTSITARTRTSRPLWFPRGFR